jgi:PAS domain S-box-containing protein
MQVVDGAPDAIVIVDHAGLILFANKSASALFGYVIGELTGQSVEALLPGRYRIRHASDRQMFTASRRFRSTHEGVELVGLRKDGTEFSVEIGLNSLEGATQPVVVATVRDITHERRGERQNVLLAALVRHARESIVIARLDGRIVFINEFGRRLHGIAPGADLNGLTIPAFVDPTHQERLQREVIPALQKIGRWSGRLDFRGPANDAPISMLATAFRIADDQGHPLAFACISTEMADLHRIDGIRAALSRTNQAIVRARTQTELLEQVCRIGVEEAGFALVWVGLLDDSGALQVVASAGPATEYLTAIRITADEQDTEGRGPGGRALRSGQHVIVEDIETSEMMRPWLDRARERGFRCSGAFPLFRDGRAIGILSAHSALIGHFGRRETSLLDVMAADISFALDNLDRAKLLSHSLGQIREIEAAVGVGALRVLLPEADFWWSDGTPEVLGLRRGTPANRQAIEEAIGPEIMLIFAAALEEAAKTGDPVDIDLPLRGNSASRNHWIRLFGVPSARPDGTTEVSCTLQDVSELKRLESEVTAAAELERHRLGAELHDNLGQILVGSSLILSSVAREARNTGSALLPTIERATGAVQEALRVCRVIAHGSDPIVHGDLSIALHELAARTTETGVQCVASVSESANIALKGAAVLEVFRIAQEAVTNALKHGKCERVEMTCSVIGHLFELVIADDGDGLDVRRAQSPGMGMRTMRHRAARAGGTLEVRSRPGHGLTIRVRVPLAEEKRPDCALAAER